MELPAILVANDAYRHAETFRVAPPARRLVVLTCMDARIDLFGALGLELGDAHILRNAGGRASADAIRSLVVSTHLLGAEEVGIIHHTRCGLEGLTDEDVARTTGVAIEFLAFADLEESVRADVRTVRSCGHLPPGVVTWGAVYDVDTGGLRVVVEPD
jgi:carbonic anhydrase